MKKVIIFIKAGPYGMASPGEGFRAVIGLAGMGFEVHTVLIDDGVFVLKKGQAPEKIEMHNLEEAYSSIPDFDAKLYAYKPSLDDRGLTKDMIIDAEIIDRDALKKLLDSVDATVTFV